MNWLNKPSQLQLYIREVKNYLPRKNRDDIAEELQLNLEERINDKEEELGRKLTDEETISLLNENGHPIRVAANYHGSSHGLVSPELFPFYKQAILAAFIVVLINLIVRMVLEIFYDITVGSSSWIWFFVNTFVYVLGCITVGFYITERTMARKHWLDSWKPKPGATIPIDSISVWTMIFYLVVLVTWLAILNLFSMDYSVDVLLGNTGNRFHTLLFWMKSQLVLSIGLYLLLVFTQQWSIGTRIFQVGTELILAVGCIICLTIDTEATRMIYSNIPSPVLTGLDFAIWGILLVSLIDAVIYGRKARQLYLKTVTNY